MMNAFASLLRRLADRISPQPDVEQWVVRYSNYGPAEIDSIWPTESEARARVDILDSQDAGCSMWEVEQWQ